MEQVDVLQSKNHALCDLIYNVISIFMMFTVRDDGPVKGNSKFEHMSYIKNPATHLHMYSYHI